MDDDLEEIAQRLDGIGEQLADRGIGILRASVEAQGDPEQVAILKEREKQLARARRSVDKAAGLLRGLTRER